MSFPSESSPSFPADPAAASALRQFSLFAALPSGDPAALARAMTPVEVAAGAAVFHEDDPADAFYAVLAGDLAVTKRQVTPATGDDTIARLHPGDTFGEIGLIEHTRRTATVRAVTPCVLWRLASADFHRLVAASSGAQSLRKLLQHAAYLGRLPALAGCPDGMLVRFAQRCLQARFVPGEPVLRQGQPNARLYLIYDGTLEVRTGGEVMGRLRPGALFGDEDPAAADVTAIEESRCLVIERGDYHAFLAQFPSAPMPDRR